MYSKDFSLNVYRYPYLTVRAGHTGEKESATVHKFELHVTPLKKLQTGSQNTNAP